MSKTYKKIEYDDIPIQVQSAIEDGTGQSIVETYANKNEIKNSTITIKQGDTVKGSFTLNQSTDATITLAEGGSTGVTSLGGKTGDITIDTGTLEFSGQQLKVASNAELDVVTANTLGTTMFSAGDDGTDFEIDHDVSFTTDDGGFYIKGTDITVLADSDGGDKFLHKNATTGELEWAAAGGAAMFGYEEVE